MEKFQFQTTIYISALGKNEQDAFNNAIDYLNAIQYCLPDLDEWPNKIQSIDLSNIECEVA